MQIGILVVNLDIALIILFNRRKLLNLVTLKQLNLIINQIFRTLRHPDLLLWGWSRVGLHINTSSSSMAAYFINVSVDLFFNLPNFLIQKINFVFKLANNCLAFLLH